MDADVGGELVLAEMGEDSPSTNHRARDFRYQHAEKSRLGDVQTQGDVFSIGRRRWARITAPRGGALLGRAARGSTLRKMACPLARGLYHLVQGSRPSTRAQGGAAWSLPLSIGERNGRQEN